MSGDAPKNVATDIMAVKSVRVEAVSDRAAGLKAISETVGIGSEIHSVDVDRVGWAKDDDGVTKRRYYYAGINDHVYAIHYQGEVFSAESPEDVGEKISHEALPEEEKGRYSDNFLEESDIYVTKVSVYDADIHYEEQDDN